MWLQSKNLLWLMQCFWLTRRLRHSVPLSFGNRHYMNENWVIWQKTPNFSCWRQLKLVLPCYDKLFFWDLLMFQNGVIINSFAPGIKKSRFVPNFGYLFFRFTWHIIWCIFGCEQFAGRKMHFNKSHGNIPQFVTFLKALSASLPTPSEFFTLGFVA